MPILDSTQQQTLEQNAALVNEVDNANPGLNATTDPGLHRALVNGVDNADLRINATADPEQNAALVD